MALVVCLLLLLGLVLGLRVPAMDMDAAQYAAIAREMLARGDWLQVVERGQPYLDKPPLVFWTAAASYRVLGVHDWSYKLPSLLALGVAVWATGRLARTVYEDDRTAALARWCLAGSLAAVLMVLDPRTDTLLMAAVAVATWQGAEWLRAPRWSALVGAAAAVGVAMLAKGPIGAVAPALALLADAWRHRRLARLADRRLVVAPVVVLAILAPMLIGLWKQFGARGPVFFFWTQSFGRVTGASEWRNDAGPLFFVHTFLWTFLPWAPLVVRRLWRTARGLRRPAPWGGAGAGAGDASAADALAAGGFVLVVAALSASRYKLPHYVYVALPGAALLAARELRQGAGAAWRWVTIGQGVLAAAGVVGVAAWAFPPEAPAWWLAVAGAVATVAWVWRHARADGEATARISVAVMAVAAIALNGIAAPAAMRYQPETAVGTAVRDAGIPEGAFVALGHRRPSLDFAARRTVPDVPTLAAFDSLLARGAPDPLVVYVRAAQADSVARLALASADRSATRAGPRAAARARAGGVPRADTIAQYEAFGVSRMNARFVDPRRRASVTERWMLLRLRRGPGA